MRWSALGVLLALSSTSSMAVRPKLTECRPGPNLRPPPREDQPPAIGPRDVVVKLYDISTPELCTAMSVLAFKPAYWFPKLSISVGRRTWSYDGEPEETYDAIIENAAGGPALRTWNKGPTSLTDEEIDAMLASMAATDYTPEEYDFFLRCAEQPRVPHLSVTRSPALCVRVAVCPARSQWSSEQQLQPLLPRPRRAPHRPMGGCRRHLHG